MFSTYSTMLHSYKEEKKGEGIKRIRRRKRKKKRRKRRERKRRKRRRWRKRKRVQPLGNIMTRDRTRPLSGSYRGRCVQGRSWLGPDQLSRLQSDGVLAPRQVPGQAEQLLAGRDGSSVCTGWKTSSENLSVQAH